MEIFCFGDSHARYFKKCNMLKWSGQMSGAAPKVTAFDYVAASAKGFAAGENSRFAYNKFMRDLGALDVKFICLAYGQVDAEVGYYFRKYVKQSSNSAEADLRNVYESYVTMAEQTLPHRPIVFKGPNPSTLRLDEQLKIYAFRRIVTRINQTSERESIWERIETDAPTAAKHGEINSMAAEILRECVESRGHIYFDIRKSVEDSAMTGMAKWEYVEAESNVHLCDSFKVRNNYILSLYEVFEGLDVSTSNDT